MNQEILELLKYKKTEEEKKQLAVDMEDLIAIAKRNGIPLDIVAINNEIETLGFHVKDMFLNLCEALKDLKICLPKIDLTITKFMDFKATSRKIDSNNIDYAVLIDNSFISFVHAFALWLIYLNSRSDLTDNETNRFIGNLIETITDNTYLRMCSYNDADKEYLTDNHDIIMHSAILWKCIIYFVLLHEIAHIELAHSREEDSFILKQQEFSADTRAYCLFKELLINDTSRNLLGLDAIAFDIGCRAPILFFEMLDVTQLFHELIFNIKTFDGQHPNFELRSLQLFKHVSFNCGHKEYLLVSDAIKIFKYYLLSNADTIKIKIKKYIDMCKQQ